MKSLHLLIHGNSLEEIKANLTEAMKQVEEMYPKMGEVSNSLSNGFEFDWRAARYMADLYND